MTSMSTCPRKVRWPRNRIFLVSILPGFLIFELQNTAAHSLEGLTIYTQIEINPANSIFHDFLAMGNAIFTCEYKRVRDDKNYVVKR